MTDGGADSIIHRKAKVAREDFDAREMSPAKALRLALAKSADAMFDLALVVRTVEQRTLPLSDIEAHAGEDGLLILLDGEDGVPGAIKLDLNCVIALIEVQLMGEVRASEPMARPFTPTDAAIVQPLMNAVLERFANVTAAQEAGTGAARGEARGDAPGALQFGDMVEDGRTLALALSALDYDYFRMTVDFGPGAKTGVMDLYLPQRPPAPKAAGPQDAGHASGELEDVALNAPVTLDTILGRLRVPLNEVCAWRSGTHVALGPGALTEAKLMAAQGHKVARVVLGQLNGFRAVRIVLSDEADPRSGHAESDAEVQLALDAPAAAKAQGLDGVVHLTQSTAADAQIVSLSQEPQVAAISEPEIVQDQELDPSTLALMASGVQP